MNDTKWTARDIPSQQGKRILITGANSGIGWHTALELARAGASIVMPARTRDKGERTVARIRQQVPDAQLETAILDLASLRSVRAFVAKVAAAPMDMVINNAGVMAIPRRELTEDGYERQFATNFLGPFALTGLLMPALLQSAVPRVVTVTSGVANTAKIEFDNLQSERKYKPMFGAYSQSKLADLIFTMELQRRADLAGIPLVSTAAHPGYAVTNLQQNEVDFATFLMTRLTRPFLSQDASLGALPTLYAAVREDSRPGGYYGPDGIFGLKGHPVAGAIPKPALDTVVAKRLWEVAENLTGVTFGALFAR